MSAKSGKTIARLNVGRLQVPGSGWAKPGDGWVDTVGGTAGPTRFQRANTARQIRILDRHCRIATDRASSVSSYALDQDGAQAGTRIGAG